MSASSARRRRRAGLVFRAGFLGVVASQVAYSHIPPPRRVQATRGIVGLLLATSTVEAAAARGRRGVAAVASAGVLGFATELVGVATGRPFGHYTYSTQLGRHVGGVPPAAAAAWAMMARPAWVAAGHATRGVRGGPLRRRAVRVLAAAGALTAWDVVLDPRMARDGYWSWPGGGRYAGIPASNFAGWFLTGTGVFAVWSVLDPDDAGPADDGALALYLWTWIGEVFANAVLWREPVVAAAGGTAMGAVAVPALRARLRAHTAGAAVR